MTGTEDSFVLTNEEIVRRTLYGISEMLNSIMSRYTPKDYAKALCGAHRQSIKSKTRTAVLDYYIINEERHYVKEPRHILQMLPTNLQNIDGSDFTDILQQFCRTFFLQNTRDKPREKRGRPEEWTYVETDFGGKYSSYRSADEYLEPVLRALKIPEIGRIIDELLLENGLLYRYQKYVCEILYNLIRICEEEKFWSVVKDFRYVKAELSQKSPKVIETFLNKIKGLHESDVQSEAEKATQTSLNRHKNSNDNAFIYVIAGVISMANNPIQEGASTVLNL